MPAQPTTALLELLADAIQKSQPPSLAITATSAVASPNLTALGDATGLAIGAIVVTPVEAVGLHVVDVDNTAHTATLSGNAGILGTEVFTFTPPANPLGMSVGLFTGTPPLTVDMLYTDLVEPTYPGYARQSVTVGTPRGDAAGDIILPLGTTTFQPTSDPVAEIVVTGFFVVISGSNTLLTAEFLPAPWAVTSHLDALDVNDDVYIPAGTVYGGICATCST